MTERVSRAPSKNAGRGRKVPGECTEKSVSGCRVAARMGLETLKRKEKFKKKSGNGIWIRIVPDYYSAHRSVDQ